MNSIRICKINITKKEPNKFCAFIFTTNVRSNLIDDQVKFNKFTNLINSCDIHTTKSNHLPENYLWQQYELFCIDLQDQEGNYDIPEKILKLSANTKVVFFNVQQNVVDESFALLAGISGIFYNDDRPDIILKGIENIKNNGLWFKRSIMDKALMGFLQQTKNEPPHLRASVKLIAKESQTTRVNIDEQEKNTIVNLTKREKTIVELVASGAQNKEIANILHISPNTVKTHIYSVFRKTNSRNRIELLSWAQQFLLANSVD